MRKRRRQAWHAKRQLLTKRKKEGGQDSKRKRRGKDMDQWDGTIKSRRIITIWDKLQVLEFRKKVLEERKAANLVLCEPNKPDDSAKDRRERNAAKRKARKVIKQRVQSRCYKEFPHIVGKCRVQFWAQTADRERWRDLPEAITRRSSTTTNLWRSQIGLPLKARKEGGGVPLALQHELDALLMEVTWGASEISERKEVVSAEQVVSRFNLDSQVQIQFLCNNTKLIAQYRLPERPGGLEKDRKSMLKRTVANMYMLVSHATFSVISFDGKSY